jgi:hypothetical protein
MTRPGSGGPRTDNMTNETMSLVIYLVFMGETALLSCSQMRTYQRRVEWSNITVYLNTISIPQDQCPFS